VRVDATVIWAIYEPRLLVRIRDSSHSSKQTTDRDRSFQTCSRREKVVPGKFLRLSVVQV